MKPTTNNLEGWEEEFDKKFILTLDDIRIDENDTDYDKDDIGDIRTGYGYSVADIKQFISNLRKHDMEELIKLIKDYYNK